MDNTFLYVVDEDEESEKAIEILDKANVKYKKIVVGKEGNGKSMWRDLQTTEIPSLQSPRGIFVGLKRIKEYIRE